MEDSIRRSRDELEVRVRERTAELERKNQELQDFAFVASHDLSEPLRKIQAFGSLLETKNLDLSEQGKDYISRMIGAANRMQDLLQALLGYSRIETKGEELRLTNLDDVVKDAISDLEFSINDIEAQVETSQLEQS
jgi:two-component system sensor kinase FixL